MLTMVVWAGGSGIPLHINYKIDSKSGFGNEMKDVIDYWKNYRSCMNYPYEVSTVYNG
jgi:hypothetical protein